MKAILGLFAIVLPVVIAHDCPPAAVIKPGDAKTGYEAEDVVHVPCDGDPGRHYKIKCLSNGNWLMTSACDDPPKKIAHPPKAVAHPPKTTAHRPPPQKEHSHTFDHYHLPGDPHYHTDDTQPHYHPSHDAKPHNPTVKPRTVKPRPPTYQPPKTQAPTQKPRSMKPCPGIPGITPGNYNQFPHGFSVIGIPCPVYHADIYAGMFDIRCDDKGGTGRWLMREDACGGTMVQQQHMSGQQQPHPHPQPQPYQNPPPQQLPPHPHPHPQQQLPPHPQPYQNAPPQQLPPHPQQQLPPHPHPHPPQPQPYQNSPAQQLPPHAHPHPPQSHQNAAPQQLPPHPHPHPMPNNMYG